MPLAVLATALPVQPASAEDECAHWGYDDPEHWSDLSVMVEPVTASEAQIAAFADLYPGNYRPAQPVGRRYVLHGD